jgi:class 3 adenylate cyclase/tetratricopeptide (TPR) repeat protein
MDTSDRSSYDPGMPVCQRCGEENPERARFCLACAAPLAAAVAARREERKRVSVLFCDLVGFTSRSERLDVEDVRSVLAPYYARLRADLERFGGTVEKFIGDAVMALFGAPTAHEDDPERAVRAALAIRDTIADLNQATPGLGLQVRVGVTTGEALVVLDARPAEGEGMASGDVVNTAARLQAAAPVDGILVDETTWRATDRQIRYQEAAPVTAKGKAEPVPAWLALAPWANLGVEVDQASRAALVGRERELELLRAALARASDEQAVQLVTLVGVPGMGKSRLVWELLQLVEAEPALTTWRQGRCLPYGEGVALWALGEVVKAQAGILDSDPADQAQAKLDQAVAELVADQQEAGWVSGHLRPLVGLAGSTQDGGGRQEEAFAAWRRFCEALAEQGPAVLVVEDLHWADETLLDFLDHLLDWAAEVPLLVVATARPELLARRPSWGGGKPNSAIVSLTALSDHDTARLVAGLLDQVLLPAELHAALLARAGGNPLYAEEYVRMLADRGFLRRVGGSWRLERAGELPLPESVQGIIAARLDALGPEEKALVQDAAVLGTVGWPGALAAVAEGEPVALEARLRALDRRAFVRHERRSAVAGERQYAFRHVLVRDVAYGQLPRAARADKHRRAAEWLEAVAPDRAEDRAELLAHHWQQAYRFARAAGQDTTTLAQRARLALRDAGDRALDLNAFAAALRWYAAALELWPAGDPERARLLLRHGRARMYAEQAGGELLAEARDGLLALGDREAAAEAEALLGQLTRWQGKGEESLEHGRRAAALLEGSEPSRAKAVAFVNLSGSLMQAGRNQEAIRVGRQALALAELAGDRGLQPGPTGRSAAPAASVATPAGSRTSSGPWPSPSRRTRPTAPTRTATWPAA